MTAPLLKIDDLSVRFGDEAPVVQDVSLTIAPGEVFSLIGESGSGKSTILNAIAGLLPSSATASGQMQLEGYEGNLLAPNARRKGIAGGEIAMIFQNPSASLNPILTIGKQLDEVVSAHRDLASSQVRAVSEELIHAVGLPSTGPQAKDWARAYPHQLSGGQKQRIAIAAALAGQPRLLLADEPTTALDATVQAQILDLLLKLVDEHGIAILFVTHDLAVAASAGDRMMVLKDGQMIEEGAALGVSARPTAAYTKTLVAAALPFTQDASPVATAMPQQTDANALVLSQIHRSFATRGGGRVQAVGGVSFHVAAGEIVGLIGESGSGKTTLGRIAVGLDHADSGSITLAGQKLNHALQRSAVQMVFQDPLASFNPRQTIARSLGHPLRCLRGMGKRDIGQMIPQMLAEVGLDPVLASRLPHQLSGGQLQRAAIARTLAADPSFLVCDEAVASLDVSVRAQILELLDRLRERQGLGILFISHDLGVVQRIATRTFVMHNGVVVESGMTNDLLATPKDPYTRELIASVPNGHQPWRTARAATGKTVEAR
ncbi:MAG: ABC transporter ATP-binding protein [Hyphomicrobiales bacterium]